MVEKQLRKHAWPDKIPQACRPCQRSWAGVWGRRRGAGDNDPAWRDEQRALYDSIRDLLVAQVGLLPVIRVFEDDVHWEREGDRSDAAKRVLRGIDSEI
jgi:hypothetical protein